MKEVSFYNDQVYKRHISDIIGRMVDKKGHITFFWGNIKKWVGNHRVE